MSTYETDPMVPKNKNNDESRGNSSHLYVTYWNPWSVASALTKWTVIIYKLAMLLINSKTDQMIL